MCTSLNLHVDIVWPGSMDPRDDYEDFGNQGVGLEDHEEVALFRSLEHELESLVQRYRVPPDELQQLFEVSNRHRMQYSFFSSVSFLIGYLLSLFCQSIMTINVIFNCYNCASIWSAFFHQNPFFLAK